MERFVINGWLLDAKKLNLVKGTRTCQLTTKSVALIELLYQAKGNTVSRESLLSLLWPDP